MSIAIEDTNIALFGTDVEYEIKKKAAEAEPAFAGAGRQPGIQIWRVNKFHLEAVPQPFTGFYAGDSYIVLRTYSFDGQTYTPDKLKHDIHFWLGQNTTADEVGTAAYKTVELDTLFDREPVEHREVQNHESQQFLNYFASYGGFRVLDGGYESGFRHVGPQTRYTPRLIHVGKNGDMYVSSEVPFARNQLVDTGVFILDAGLTLYQWHGKRSSAFNRNRAATISRTIDVERNGGVKVIVVDQGEEPAEFWDLFPVQAREITFQHNRVTAPRSTTPTLWVLSDDGTFVRADNSDVWNEKNIVINDQGNRVWVWVGASRFRDGLIQEGQKYLRQVGRPDTTPISVVKQGNDTSMLLPLV